ncbi:MAG: hypothetical protein EPO42_05460 [Gallionellaceae bacterium]|nr:MAG: hypothetical protein EPO42_05460 [Gallionellaceae bacterium]
MNNRVRQILEQIAALEDELHTVVEQQEGRLRYQIEGKRVTFEHAIKDAHRKVKIGIFRWFATVRPQNYLTAPIIYGMAIPLLVFDLCISFYQLTCFRVYRIARVKRSDYFSMDHRHLAYLNVIEKAHCMYCSYAVGLLAYATEITARTEQYFCPIKHARKVPGMHARYKRFLEYGEAENLHEKVGELRNSLAREIELAAKARRRET